MAIASGLDLDIVTARALAQQFGLRRTGALAESFSRVGVTPVAFAPTSAREYYTALYIPGGTLVSNLTFLSVAAAVTPTNSWATLYDINLNRLAVSADKLTAVWGANSELAFNLSASVNFPADTLVFVGLTQVAATPATVASNGLSAAMAALAPAVGFVDNTNAALTTPASSPAVAVNSAGSTPLYVWAS